MKHWLRVISCLFALALSACSSTYKVPTTHMISPEAEGRSLYTLEAGIRTPYEVIITNSIANTPVTSSTHEVNVPTTVGGTGEIGVFDQVDLGVNVDLAVVPIFFAKLQIIGDPKRKAEYGNLSLAITGGFGFPSSIDETATNIFSNNTGKIHTDEDAQYHAGVILGYRVSPSFLTIAGYSRNWQHFKGSQTLAAGGNPIGFEDHPQDNEVHLGVEIDFVQEKSDQKFFIKPMVERGWLTTFGSLNWRTTAMLDLGYQF